MRRYLLSFLGAYVVSLLMFVGMLLMAIANWLFSDTPIWFDILCVFAVTLPVLALGEVAGRHPGKNPPERPWRGLVILLVVMGVLAVFSGMNEALQFLSWPGLLVGGALKELLNMFLPVSNYWEGLFLLLGNLLLPGLFHLGWMWGRNRET